MATSTCCCPKAEHIGKYDDAVDTLLIFPSFFSSRDRCRIDVGGNHTPHPARN